MTADAELLARCAQRDAQAFETLVSLHRAFA
jgi:hypothetical protein